MCLSDIAAAIGLEAAVCPLCGSGGKAPVLSSTMDSMIDLRFNVSACESCGPLLPPSLLISRLAQLAGRGGALTMIVINDRWWMETRPAGL